MPETTTTCPRCGRPLDLVPHPTRNGRLIGYCECNQGRSVLEVNTPPEEKPKRRRKEPPPVTDIIDDGIASVTAEEGGIEWP